MSSRREFLINSSAVAAGIGLASMTASGEPPAKSKTSSTTATADGTGFTGPIIMRAIPVSGERIPVIGMGTSGTFEVGKSAAELDPLREVLKVFIAGGATVIDTAPTYGRAED